jgi:hypothetical protein
MFILKLYDRLGNELKEGDTVKVSCNDGYNRKFKFYCEVKYLEDEKTITPFHTFSFHSFEKVDKIPDNAKISQEKRYKIWYVNESDQEEDNYNGAEEYLISWRQCEHLLKNCYKIEKINN